MKSIIQTHLSIFCIPNAIYNFEDFLDLPVATKIIKGLVTEADDDDEDNLVEFLIAFQVSEIRLHLESAGQDCTKLSRADREGIFEFSVDYISENIAAILEAISPKSLERFCFMVEAGRQELRAQSA
jgi:hypothetical protein